MEEFFGEVSMTASKRPMEDDFSNRTKHRRPGHKGGKGAGSSNGSKGHHKDTTNSSLMETEDMEEAFRLACRLLLQNTDSIHVLRQDTAIVWFARTSQPTVVPTLFAAATKWKDDANREQPSAVGRLPLREVLFMTMIHTLLKELREVEKDEELRAKYQFSGWLDKECRWVFQKWDPDTRTLLVDTNRRSIPIPDMIQNVQAILDLITQHHVLHRFHSTRRLSQDLQGIAVLLMDVSVRETQGTRLFQQLLNLQNNAVWQLIGLQYKREGLRRSPLAVKLQEWAYGSAQ
ncbi:unnamed protein product [Symbiodinium natans]|uniref:Uncharacterized protein n=1 Tax=Symbiodinium natans TaxID=878477 RepID=A0A812MND3_9DINO|nr:unnamed protein product [Symbiodinium natans]